MPLAVGLILIGGGVQALAAGPFPDRVAEFAVGHGGGFNAEFLPEIVLGAPRGGGLLAGSTDVVSLGSGGRITVEFVATEIVDGQGPDFTVFENAFLPPAGLRTGRPFAEPARVLVSADGIEFTAFPCALDDAGNLFPGCAGIYPVFSNRDDPATGAPTTPTAVPITALIGLPLDPPPAPPGGSGGDSFDLAQVGLARARFVRIVSGPGALPAGGGQAGFDLDAVVAVNWRTLGSDRDGDGTTDALDPCPNDPACGPLAGPAYVGRRVDREAEHFVTFAAPGARITTLAAAAPTVEIRVNFGPMVQPDTLRVKIRGRDATALFLPVIPGTSRRVTIGLRGRRTPVVFRAKGMQHDGRVARDVDRLVFRRQRK